MKLIFPGPLNLKFATQGLPSLPASQYLPGQREAQALEPPEAVGSPCGSLLSNEDSSPRVEVPRPLLPETGHCQGAWIPGVRAAPALPVVQTLHRLLTDRASPLPGAWLRLAALDVCAGELCRESPRGDRYLPVLHGSAGRAHVPCTSGLGIRLGPRVQAVTLVKSQRF